MKKIKSFPVANCPLCALELSDEIKHAIFFREILDDIILEGIFERTGCFVSEKELQICRQHHMGVELPPIKKEKINEIDFIDERLTRLKKRMEEMESKKEIFSNGYAGMIREYTNLLKLRNEIREGTKLNVTGKISVVEWANKFISDKKQKEEK